MMVLMSSWDVEDIWMMLVFAVLRVRSYKQDVYNLELVLYTFISTSNFFSFILKTAAMAKLDSLMA